MEEDPKRTFTKVELDKDFKASVDRMESLRAGRPISEIPLHDEYWKAAKKHQIAHSHKD